ncbi:hypothetical protein [Actinomycetospora chiangmaiensis]|uniref:hypothetical protein n=1 Tax=Actinomycetospora chiangmaiensis TaxID=402650 RepID=UPI000382C500|nr:hypothetical protein [Actinomycetospora chiangmaiensis]
MRLTRIAVATLVAGALTFAGTGVALADTVTPAADTSAVTAASEPGDLMLSATSVKPGARITFSGSFAEAAASTATGPISVTSSAFAGPATLSRTNPEAFSGSATVANGTKAGTYTVTASSSAGTVSARLTVSGTVPPPVPAHHGGHSSGTSGQSGTSGAGSTDAGAAVDPAGSDVLPWALGAAGAITLVGGGAYAVGRGRRADREMQAAQARQDYREPRTDVMTRR